jgi:hypothetical protein
MILFKKKSKTSRDLWQVTLDKTNQEIFSGKYRVKFSAFEVFIFPKPTLLQKWTLNYLAPLYRKAKQLSKKFFIVLVLFLAVPATAVRLPRRVTLDEFQTLISTLAFGHATKVMRSAETYPSLPGLKIALETPLVYSGKLQELGDGSASLPIVIPAPRLTITKGLGYDLEASFNISTQELLETMASLGFLAKWTFLDEKDSFFSSSIFASYTRLNGFNNTFSGSDFEVGVLASQDWVRIKPYVGLGLLLASAKVAPSISPSNQTGSAFSPHLFLGVEIELVMNMTFQMDFTSLVPNGSLALGYRF